MTFAARLTPVILLRTPVFRHSLSRLLWQQLVPRMSCRTFRIHAHVFQAFIIYLRNSIRFFISSAPNLFCVACLSPLTRPTLYSKIFSTESTLVGATLLNPLHASQWRCNNLCCGPCTQDTPLLFAPQAHFEVYVLNALSSRASSWTDSCSSPFIPLLCNPLTSRIYLR